MMPLMQVFVLCQSLALNRLNGEHSIKGASRSDPSAEYGKSCTLKRSHIAKNLPTSRRQSACIHAVRALSSLHG